jgi:hypothetical protein
VVYGDFKAQIFTRGALCLWLLMLDLARAFRPCDKSLRIWDASNVCSQHYYLLLKTMSYCNNANMQYLEDALKFVIVYYL